MRILQVTEAGGSGTFEVVRMIAGGASAAGHEVCVALGERPETPGNLRSLLPATVTVEPLPWGARTARSQLLAARRLRALAGWWKPDVVHLHSSFAGAVGAAVLAGRHPTVYTPHASPVARITESPARRAAYRLVELAVVRRCAVFGAVSEAEARLARETLRASRIAVVPNGIPDLDPGRTPPSPPRDGRPVVVAAGRIGAQRRPAETAGILAGLADLAEVRWIGGAPGNEDAPLRAAGIPVTGWVPREQALDALARADVLVHWSAWDGLSLTVLEALARDVVVIASDIPPNREVLGDLQVAPSPEAAVALVREVLSDPRQRERLLAEQRRRRVAFGAQRMIDAWCALYADVASTRQAPSRGVRRSRDASR